MADSIRLEVKGLAEVKRRFELLAKNAPAMASKAINAAALTAKDALIGSTFGVFNTPPGKGPTPYTIKSFSVSLATPTKLEASAGLKEYQPKTASSDFYSFGRKHYLYPQVFGGTRPMKRSEEALGGYYVPGAAAKLNAYGNVAQLQQILSAVGARFDPYQVTDVAKSATTRRGTRPSQRNRRLYWLGRLGKKRTLGVWAIGEDKGKRGEKGYRSGRIRPVLIFPDQGQRKPKYAKRWPFYAIARKEFNRNIPRFVNKYYTQWVAGQ